LHVNIDEERFLSSESTFVAVELMDSMGHVADPSAEDAFRSGFATEDPDTQDVDGDIPLTTSAIVDINNTREPHEAATLQKLARMKPGKVLALLHTTTPTTTSDLIAPNATTKPCVKPGVTINVVTGKTILHQYDTETYFMSAFPTIFPYGTGKHLDQRRSESELAVNLPRPGCGSYV
jgi:hypothetical protein